MTSGESVFTGLTRVSKIEKKLTAVVRGEKFRRHLPLATRLKNFFKFNIEFVLFQFCRGYVSKCVVHGSTERREKRRERMTRLFTPFYA